VSNVIEVNFTDIKEDSGYIINGYAVDGVYKGDIVAVRKDDSNCVLGFRGDGQVINPIESSIADLNRFCFMWLCIFDESVIVKEDEDNQDE